MKRGILIFLILSVISATLLWYFWCSGIGTDQARQQHKDDNDPCVSAALKDYSKTLAEYFDAQFPAAPKNPGNEGMHRERSEGAETRSKEKLIITNIEAADLVRQDFACLGYYLPFKIEGGDIQPYPDRSKLSCPLGKPTSPSNPSQIPPPKPTPTPLPQSIKDNGSQILVLAKSVGRLGIQRIGSQYSQFWGTGFLVANSTGDAASDVIVTACHVMDPIMKVEDGKHHLHLDGEELRIDFKGYENGADYDYHCPIKDVVACSSQEGVDVALLSFERGQCSGSGVLPSGAQLDVNEPTTTVAKKDKKGKPDECTASAGINCLAMIAYADIDHPIDAPTNAVYRVYQDKNYGDFQFVMNDDVAAVEQCDKEPNVEIMMDIGTTTVGESGGVLTYFNRTKGGKKRSSKSGDPLIVSGMHTCCSAFFKYDYEIPPASNTACAHLRRTLDNQAISTWSMLKDHDICSGLKDHNALPQGYNCP